MTDPKNIDEVILALQAELPVLAKSKSGQVGNQKTKYADLVQVNDVVLKRLNAMHTIWTCRPHLQDGSFGLHYSLKHVPSGTEHAGVWPLKLSENPQQMGSATTYGRRYALLAVTGIVSEDEDDDGAAGGPPSAQRAASARRQALNTASPARQDRPTAQRTQRPAGPPLPGEEGNGMTRPQQGKIHALFGEVGIADRGDRMTYVNEVLADKVGPDRQIASSSELTKVEAGHVIEALQRWADQLAPEGGE
jgi:hypothetical protein